MFNHLFDYMVNIENYMMLFYEAASRHRTHPVHLVGNDYLEHALVMDGKNWSPELARGMFADSANIPSSVAMPEKFRRGQHDMIVVGWGKMTNEKEWGLTDKQQNESKPVSGGILIRHSIKIQNGEYPAMMSVGELEYLTGGKIRLKQIKFVWHAQERLYRQQIGPTFVRLEEIILSRNPDGKTLTVDHPQLVVPRECLWCKPTQMDMVNYASTFKTRGYDLDLLEVIPQFDNEQEEMIFISEMDNMVVNSSKSQ